MTQILAWTPPLPNNLGNEDNLLLSGLFDRRDFLVHQSSSVSSSLVLAVAVPQQQPQTSRFVDVGNGLDLRQPPLLKANDELFPSSMQGVWDCQRIVLRVEGDVFMAETTWRALGGGGGGKAKKWTEPEKFMTRFLPVTATNDTYVVMDRAYETSSRAGADTSSDDILWDQGDPNHLQYNNNNNKKVKLSVLRRTIEVPSDQGFGYQEFVAIQDGIVERAALLKRRYRRAFDSDGNRIVEGLEIVKTFRVLDGIAGELPISTTKSQLRLTRPT